jgi:hypothetical protein
LEVLPWRRRYIYEQGRILVLRAHLEDERRTSLRRAHFIHGRSFVGGVAHLCRGEP